MTPRPPNLKEKNVYEKEYAAQAERAARYHKLDNVGVASDIPVPASAFDHVNSAMNEAKALAHRVVGVVERLAGSANTAGTDPVRPSSTSLLGDLRGHASDLEDAVRSAHAEIDRLERQI